MKVNSAFSNRYYLFMMIYNLIFELFDFFIENPSKWYYITGMKPKAAFYSAIWKKLFGFLGY